MASLKRWLNGGRESLVELGLIHREVAGVLAHSLASGFGLLGFLCVRAGSVLVEEADKLAVDPDRSSDGAHLVLGEGTRIVCADY